MQASCPEFGVSKRSFGESLSSYPQILKSKQKTQQIMHLFYSQWVKLTTS